MNNLIAFTGHKRSGKDTATQFLIDNYDYTRLAFADPVKKILDKLDPFMCGRNPSSKESWHPRAFRLSELKVLYTEDYIKDNYPEYRRLAQLIGTEIGRDMFGENVWIDMAFKSVVEPSKLVITDLRFPNEAEAVRQRGGLIIRINRPETVTVVDNHASERLVDTIQPDLIISNHGSILDLHERLVQFVVNPL